MNMAAPIVGWVSRAFVRPNLVRARELVDPKIVGSTLFGVNIEYGNKSIVLASPLMSTNLTLALSAPTENLIWPNDSNCILVFIQAVVRPSGSIQR
jgi:hypothetical protein